MLTNAVLRPDRRPSTKPHQKMIRRSLLDRGVVGVLAPSTKTSPKRWDDVPDRYGQVLAISGSLNEGPTQKARRYWPILTYGGGTSRRTLFCACH
jgi:hypothetical protein